MFRTIAIALLASIMLAAGCSDDSTTDVGGDTGGDDGGDAAGGDGAEPSGADLQLAETELGEIVVDGNGRTLYLFSPDEAGDSTCYDECEANWPIVPEAEAAGVGEGLDQSLLGTTTRTNGDIQATYNGWPLYRYIGDSQTGDTTGQGLQGIWWVIDSAGNPVETAGSEDEPAGRAGY